MCDGFPFPPGIGIWSTNNCFKPSKTILDEGFERFYVANLHCQLLSHEFEKRVRCALIVGYLIMVSFLVTFTKIADDIISKFYLRGLFIKDVLKK